ncbi:MAG TPA: crosslink repair DNA glycosylase YcaQ family protein, partial [Fimbriimonadaceae bacterium]|nr:crosslink repair DNA glycosylase YcaQ family protein [Fimbriimonadaceae bacterium]
MATGKLKAFWFDRLGLANPTPMSAGDVFRRFGWARSVGGANPYLSLFARAGIGREQADRAAANLEIHELPSVRGCTYVVPSEDFAVALRLARGEGDPQDVATAKRHLGVTEAELFKLQEKVLQTLGHDPLDPKEIKDRVGDAVRSLGDEGKKRGMQTTLPRAREFLQTAGLNGRV